MTMKQLIKSIQIVIISSCFLVGCSKNTEVIKADYLISNALVYSGNNEPEQKLDVAICGSEICYVGSPNSHIDPKEMIDATGLILTPGFIDPHTHSMGELLSEKKNSNINYLTQGVTTVINGNDGDGSADIEGIRNKVSKSGIGTNLGLLVGHGFIRKQVMGLSNKSPSAEELQAMKNLVRQAMQQGALGFSSGLYYVPGNYSKTEEVIELAKVAAEFNGIYDSHLRDESTFNIGFLDAIKEHIEIVKQAKIKGHIAHIKALGVDVWGLSKPAIELVNKARDEGFEITADQYPWQASGTHLRNAVVPSELMADSVEAFVARLNDEKALPEIKEKIKENIRRRGGATSLLVTASKNPSWLGKNLQEIADEAEVTPTEAVIMIVQQEKIRVASFNMSMDDIRNFMAQPWVVSSSDGTNGHPRKYASFPQKYESFILNDSVMPLHTFIHKSSAKTAEIFSIAKRGLIEAGFYADINLIKLSDYKARADFSSWNKLSTGVEYQFVNGVKSISNGKYTGALAGKTLSNSQP
ncbi:MAG: N-acyl-D-amino-acid deacylase family protein [Kangiellaceae bacterium]